jgi:A predicted alpha-helical domain with a conserved ER motif.
MLNREQLTDEEWRAVRDTPHHVALAVSAAEGSLLDEMLERSAAMSGIVDAQNSRHPLLNWIAASANIMDAQDQLRCWYHGLTDSERCVTRLQSTALAMFKDAVRALRDRGGSDDVEHYADFVVGLATRVARSAREGDVLGFGGELMSASERSFIAQLEATVVTDVR